MAKGEHREQKVYPTRQELKDGLREMKENWRKEFADLAKKQPKK